MSDSSNNRPEPAKPNMKSAIIWAVVVGLITAGLAFWILGSQTILVRLGAGVFGGVIVAISSYRKSITANTTTGGKDE